MNYPSNTATPSQSPSGGKSTNQQIEELLPRLSLEEHGSLKNAQEKGALRQVLLTGPLIALSFGPLVFAKRRFPKYYKEVLSRPWFYVPFSMVTFSFGSYWITRSSKAMVQKEVDRLYEKYGAEAQQDPAQPGVTYEELQRRHRAAQSTRSTRQNLENVQVKPILKNTREMSEGRANLHVWESTAEF